MKIRYSAAAIALAFVAGPALAADLPSTKGPPVFAAPAPAFTWTGFYAGVNVGGGWTESETVTGVVSFIGIPFAGWAFPAATASGVIGGGQIGYNFQFNGFVAGVEADIQAADLTGASNGVGVSLIPILVPIVQAHQTIDWFGTVRSRLGYSILPNLLVYGTGGFAYGGVTSRISAIDNFGIFSGLAAQSDTRTGWTAGGGVEWAFFPGWSAKVEYLFVDLSPSPALASPVFIFGTFIPGLVGTNSGFNNRFHTVKAGLNYHFNLFGAAPVVAGY